VAPGSLLGLPALSGDEPYSMTAVAHAGAVLGFVTRDVFSRLMLINDRANVGGRSAQRPGPSQHSYYNVNIINNLKVW
jgi:hypothetical protein